MKHPFFIVALTIIGVGIVESSLLIWRFSQGARVAEESVPFEVRVPGARARILVIGDSTGVGTGAARPQESIAGRIAHEFPSVEIANRAANGVKVENLLEQFHDLINGTFDIVLVQVGGNDILRFTSLDRLRRGITSVLKRARMKGRHVIFISTGNVGSAPAFFPPLSWIYTYRTRKVRAIFMDVSSREEVQYVDLFKERKDDPFLEDPETFYAPDFLHPAGEGYRLWYEEMKRQTSFTAILQTRAVH